MSDESLQNDPFETQFDATELSSDPGERHLVVVPYEEYEIVVEVTQEGHFVGIVEIRIKQDFLSPVQRAAASGYHDVESFYED